MPTPASQSRGFGFPYWRGLGVADLVEIARAAQKAGFASAWAPEVAGADPWVVLGATAAAAPGLRLGTGLLQVGTRSPVVAAAAAVTTAQVSGQPFSLGLGISTRQIVEDWHGVAHAPAQDRLREYVTVARSVVAGEATAVEGKHFSSHGYRSVLGGAPVSVHLGGLGDTMVRLAGEIGDGLMLGNVGAAVAGRKAELFRESARQHGRGPGPVDVLVRACVTTDPEPATAWMKREIVRYCAAPAYRRLFVASGYGDAVRQIQEHVSEGDRGAAIDAVPAELVDEVSAIGDAQAVDRHLQAYEKLGMRVIVVPFDADERISVAGCSRTLQSVADASS